MLGFMFVDSPLFSLYSLSLSCECVSVYVLDFGLPSILRYLGNALFDALH